MPSVSLRINIVANYFGRAYSMAAAYLFIPFYVAILGPAAYGVIAFYAVMLAIAALADVGLSSTFAREAARETAKPKLINLLSAAERILLVGVGALSLAAFVSAGWIVEHWLNVEDLDRLVTINSLRLMAIMIAPQILISLYSAGLLGLQRQVSANAIQALFVTCRSGLVIAVILWKPDLSTFFLWQLGSTVLFVFITRTALMIAMEQPWCAIAPFRFASVQPHIRYAGGMLLLTIIAGINTQLDKLIVSRSLTLSEFGYYSLASLLAQIPIALTTPIAVALFPKLTEHIAKGEMDRAYKYYKLCAQLIAFIGALAAAGLILFSREILTIWLHQPSLPDIVAQVTSMLAVGGLFLCLSLLPYYLSLAHGKNRIIAVLASSTLLTSIPLTIIAINLYGLVGAASVWIALNLTNYVAVTLAIHRKYYRDRIVALALDSVAVPIALAAAPLYLARLAANEWTSGPLNAVLWAAAGATVAIGAFGTLHRFPLRKGHGSV